MKIRFQTFKSFYMGLTIAPMDGYVSLGLGFCSFTIDKWMDRLEKGDWPLDK